MARILIVDDDPDLVKSMKVVLENKGYEVISSSTGADGLNLAKKEKPNLIILDVMMETGDKGFDIARSLKSDEKTKHIPILMLTAIKGVIGIDFKQEAGDAFWLPVDDYCDKPLRPSELVSKVEKLLVQK